MQSSFKDSAPGREGAKRLPPAMISSPSRPVRKAQAHLLRWRSRMSKRQWSLLVAALVVVALLAPAGFAQAPIKVGVIEPLSGSVAASGNYVRMGGEIARDWINAKGGVNGRKVELVIEDNKSDPKEAASAAEQ